MEVVQMRYFRKVYVVDEELSFEFWQSSVIGLALACNVVFACQTWIDGR